MTRTPQLPADVYAAIAAGGEVRLPAGTFAPVKPLVVTVPGTRLVGDGCTLEYGLAGDAGKPNWRGLLVASQRRPAKGADQLADLVRAVGVLDGGRRTLSVPGGWPTGDVPQAGEVMLCSAGVNLTDPAEPHDTAYLTVESATDKSVTFVDGFPRPVPVYRDYDQLRGLVGPTWAYKVAGWGVRNAARNQSGRGLGDEHGLIRFAGGRPVGDVRIDCPLTITVADYDGPSKLPLGSDGGAAVFLSDARGLTWSSPITVGNCPGHGVHLSLPCDVTLPDITCTGFAGSKTFGGPNPKYLPSYCLTVGGGGRVRAGRVTATGPNWAALGSEVQPRDVTVASIDMDSQSVGLDPTAGAQLNLNTNGGLRGNSAVGPVRLRRLTHLDTDAMPAGLRVDGLAVDTGLLDTLMLARYTWTAPVRLGADTLLPPVPTAGTFTVPAPGGPGQREARRTPAGRWTRLRIRVAAGTLAGLVDGFGYPYPVDGSWAAVNDQWSQVPPGRTTFAAPLAFLRLFWADGQTAPAVVEYAGERMSPPTGDVWGG